MARVLRPGGRFVVTFSNRWFRRRHPGLGGMHEFEAPGLVMEYFLRDGAADSLQTLVDARAPRPAGDKYATRRRH